MYSKAGGYAGLLESAERERQCTTCVSSVLAQFPALPRQSEVIIRTGFAIPGYQGFVVGNEKDSDAFRTPRGYIDMRRQEYQVSKFVCNASIVCLYRSFYHIHSLRFPKS